MFVSSDMVITGRRGGVVGEPAGFRDFAAARSATLLRTGWLLTGDWQLAQASAVGVNAHAPFTTAQLEALAAEAVGGGGGI